MDQYLCLKDEDSVEVPGSRRKVDFARDPEHFRRVYVELQLSAGEGCWVYDSHQDGHAPTLLGSALVGLAISAYWLGVAFWAGTIMLT